MPAMPVDDGLARQVWPRLLLVLTVLFWSGNSIVGKAIHELMPPIALAFWRWTLAALLLLPFVFHRLRDDWPAIRANLPVLLLLSAVGVASFNTFLYAGLHSTTAVNALLLQTITPLLIVALSALAFRDRISRAQGFGILLALLGVLLIIGEGQTRVLRSIALNRGDLLICAGVICYSSYTVLLRYRPSMHALSFLTVTFIIGSLQLLPFYLWEMSTVAPVTLTGPTLAAIGYVAVFPSIISYLCFNRGVEAIGASQAGVFIYLMPVFGSGMAIGFLGESLFWFHAVGAGLIAAGIWLASIRRRQRDA